MKKSIIICMLIISFLISCSEKRPEKPVTMNDWIQACNYVFKTTKYIFDDYIENGRVDEVKLQAHKNYVRELINVDCYKDEFVPALKEHKYYNQVKSLSYSFAASMKTFLLSSMRIIMTIEGFRDV